MSGHHAGAAREFDAVGEGPQEQRFVGDLDRHRVAIALESDQGEMVGPDRRGPRARERRRQGQEMFPLYRQPLADGLLAPAHPSFPLLPALFTQVVVERFPGGELSGRDKPVSPAVANPTLYASLLPAGTGIAEVGLKQVVAAQADERRLFLPVAPVEHLQHGCLEVVVPDLLWHAAEEVESCGVAVKEDLLWLRRVGFHEGGAGV